MAKTEICMTEGCSNRFPIRQGGKLRRFLCDDCRRERVLRMQRERNRQYKRDIREGNRKPQQLDYRYRTPDISDAKFCKYCGGKLADSNKTDECLRECAGKKAWFKAHNKPYLPMFSPGGGDDECVCHANLSKGGVTSEQSLMTVGYTAGA